MFKKKLDERQQKEFYKAEHYAFYAMFIILAIIVLIEQFFLGMDFKSTIGESIVLWVGAGTFAFNCLKSGNWDYSLKPSMRTYLLLSFISAVIVSIVFTLGMLYQYEAVRQDIWGRVVPIGLCMFFSLFIVIFIALAVSGEISKKRRKKLEEQFMDEE